MLIIIYGASQISILTPRYFRVKQVKNVGNTIHTIAISFTIPIMYSPAAPMFGSVVTETLVTNPS